MSYVLNPKHFTTGMTHNILYKKNILLMTLSCDDEVAIIIPNLCMAYLPTFGQIGTGKCREIYQIPWMLWGMNQAPGFPIVDCVAPP